MTNQTPQSTDTHIVLPRDLAQRIINYLETRPHREVRGLIDGVLSCNPRPPAPPKQRFEKAEPEEKDEEPGLAPEPQPQES